MMVVKTKKEKPQKICQQENHKNSLEANQLENEINYLEKNEININSLKKIAKNS